MSNLDDPRAIRLRAYELTHGEIFVDDDGRLIPVGVAGRLEMAAEIAAFISTGEMPKADVQ
jgi:hypothetical protein